MDAPSERIYANSSCPECEEIFRLMKSYIFCPDVRVLFCTEKCHMAFHNHFHNWSGSHNGSGSSEDKQERVNGSRGRQSESSSEPSETSDESSVSPVWHASDADREWLENRS